MPPEAAARDEPEPTGQGEWARKRRSVPGKQPGGPPLVFCNFTAFGDAGAVELMGAYLFRRLLLVIPTLFGIIAINFVVVQFAPGGPVEQMVAELKGRGGGATARMTGAGAAEAMPVNNATYRGARGLDPHVIADIKKMFGFDKPAPERFLLMLRGYLTFDFGRSFFRDESVLQLIKEKMPVSVSLGLWSTLLVYFVSIPLGIAKAVHDGSRFDVISSAAVLIGYAVPGFLFAILLVVLFAGGSFVQWFPLRGLHSTDTASWSIPARIVDYLWHMVLPTVALVVGGFAGLTVLTKNCFLEEIRKQYVITARAKGASEQRILYRHVFRNAMLLIIAGFPAAFIGILFSSALLVEIIFSLDGLGLLGFESAIRRDYPVMFGTLYMFTLLGLLMQIVGDLLYTVVDPRIDFEARQ
jgi:microcin C transport system permease protein